MLEWALWKDEPTECICDLQSLSFSLAQRRSWLFLLASFTLPFFVAVRPLTTTQADATLRCGGHAQLCKRNGAFEYVTGQRG